MGKLIIIEELERVKSRKEEGYPIRTIYGVKDEELGIVIKPRFQNRNIQILDDNNVFVWFDECDDWHRGMNMRHFQRDNNNFLIKYVYSAPFYGEPLPPVKRISNDNVVIAKISAKSAIYSLSRCEALTVDFKAISEFSGEEGEKKAIVEILVPLDPFKKKPINFLYGEIDENGVYVNNIFDINGVMYDITSKEYQVWGRFSARKLVEFLEKRDRTKDIEEQRLFQLYFSPRKN